MLAKRIIPCLDVKDGLTVKGTNFVDIKAVGDPVALAARYAEEGADELVFLDITATTEKRKTLVPLVKRVAQAVNIPFTVGGGISSVSDVEALLHAGADKISINSAAVKQPALIRELADNFGSQCVVLAVDSRKENGSWWVYLNGGRLKTDIKTTDWVSRAVALGAGEILLTSINHDGMGNGFAVEHTREIAGNVKVPVIASGGAGSAADFEKVFRLGHADAALAAGIFHRREVSIQEVKAHLAEKNIPVRIAKS